MTKIQSKIEHCYRLLEKADNEETASPMGAIILAISEVAEAITLLETMLIKGKEKLSG